MSGVKIGVTLTHNTHRGHEWRNSWENSDPDCSESDVENAECEHKQIVSSSSHLRRSALIRECHHEPHPDTTPTWEQSSVEHKNCLIVKLRQGSGKDRQGMALKAKGFMAETLA